MLSYSVRTSGATRTQYRRCSRCPATDKQILRLDKFMRYVLDPSNNIGCDMENHAYHVGKESKP